MANACLPAAAYEEHLGEGAYEPIQEERTPLEHARGLAAAAVNSDTSGHHNQESHPLLVVDRNTPGLVACTHDLYVAHPATKRPIPVNPVSALAFTSGCRLTMKRRATHIESATTSATKPRFVRESSPKSSQYLTACVNTMPTSTHWK